MNCNSTILEARYVYWPVRKNWRFTARLYFEKAAMVYGKRRVGKTTLIQKALKSSSYRTVYL